MVTMEVGYGRR
jgi:hypothetical protein